MRAVQKWFDRVVTFVSPTTGIRRRRARAALEAFGKPPREPPHQRPRARGFNVWWEQRLAERRGWGVGSKRE